MSTEAIRDRIKQQARIKSAEGRQAETPAVPVVKAKKVGPIAFYDSNKNGYWSQNTRADWVNYSESSIRRILKYQKFSSLTDKEALAAMIDKELMGLQTEHDVAYAGPIAGYTHGLHTICNQRVLVTSGPKLIRPAEGNCQFLKKFIEDLLRGEAKHLYAWLKSGLRSLYAGPEFRPGQMLAIAGPAGCGKSLLQNVITEIFGGRSAKPYRYMIGETSFNSDLFAAEHLMIEDEAASNDLRIRRTFGSMLKNMIVNVTQSLHRKGREALSVSPFWRVTITLNDEPENLMVLPPLDESLRDKVTLLKAYMAEMPYVTDDMNGRKLFRQKLTDEIPAFLKFLQGWRIPQMMLNKRYGVSAYQNADLVQALLELSPEAKLLNLIDSLMIWNVDMEPWKGTSRELEERLLEKDKSGRVAKLLNYNSACGVYLARLPRHFPDRVIKHEDRSRQIIWEIHRPTK